MNFTVSGLPTGATFQFSPTSVTPTAGATANTTLNITTGTYTAPPPNPYEVSGLRRGPGVESLAAGALVPFGFLALLPALRKRKRSLKAIVLGGGAMPLLLVALSLSACGGSKGGVTNPNPTPVGTSTVTITAASGSLIHTTTLTLTVQ
ncbi:MAG TPA: hypothetical protein VGI45_19955 [Terracidiphilus sp.]